MDIITMQSMLNTLNQIEVKGKDNVSALLGCIFAMEQAIGDYQAQAAAAEVAATSAPKEVTDG